MKPSSLGGLEGVPPVASAFSPMASTSSRLPSEMAFETS
jgi:hypothetical protein